MKATDLAGSIWNSISDLVQRNRAPREIYFVKVKKVDKVRRLIWAEDFGNIAIPLVAHNFSFDWYDTTPVGDAYDGEPVTTKYVHRADPTQKKPAHRVKIVCPSKGDLVIVLDPWGAQRFPICIGTIQSKKGFWEGE